MSTKKPPQPKPENLPAYECEFCRALASGDPEVIAAAEDEAIANGTAFVMEDEQLAYFVNHLKPEERRDYDPIAEHEGVTAAFAFTLKKVLQRDFSVYYQPERRLQ